MKYPLGSPQAMKLEKSLVEPYYWMDQGECAHCGGLFFEDDLNENELCDKCEIEWKKNLEEQEEE